LYQSNENPVESTFIEAMGYGTTGFGEAKSNVLLKGELKITNSTFCNRGYDEDFELPQGITSSQICAFDPEGNRDTW
jgi:hypothetical protein